MKAGALLLALMLAGCTVGPDFKRPKVAVAPAFGPTRTDVASRYVAGKPDAAWWRTFQDAELTSLVGRLAAQNIDLQEAAERITQARAIRRIVSAQGLPRVSATGRAVRQRESPTGIASLVEPAPDAPLEFYDYEAQGTASWEIDLFGRVRRLAEAADANAAAAVEARRGLAIAAIADLAQSYFQLRLVQAQFDVLNRNLKLAEDRRALVRNRFVNGVATTLDVAQADTQALAIAQDLPTLRTQQARLINAIGLLLAEPPRTLANELTRAATQPPTPPTVPIGLPADLARRRPDVREAEERLHAATAQTGVAVADFYPRVTLGGSFGLESLHLGSLFDWDSRQFMLGPILSLPIFQGGRLTGTLRLREAQQREAALEFRKIVLRAWHEVDDALVGYGEAQRRRVDAAGTREASVRALTAADQQYRAGVTTLLDVIVAQESVLRSENTVVQAQADQEQRLVNLYRALGGGWQQLPGETAASAR